MTGLELLTVGRVSVDLYPQQSGVPLSGVSSFAKSIVAGRLMCSDAMPTTAEINAVLAGGDPSEAEAA